MNKVALITGAAKRIGAVIAVTLQQQGFNVVVHYHHSAENATALCQELNSLRRHSAVAIPADIRDKLSCQQLIERSYAAWGRLDLVVNNASSFYPTPVGSVVESEWDDLLGSNLKGPFFLCQAAAPLLKDFAGNIINIVDVHAERPLKNYPVYCIAKAGLVMLTKALARELAPAIRVNAIAPGVILWPNQENSVSEEVQHYIVDRTCLKRTGRPQDIADTILFLTKQNYITGQVIAVDGGRSIKD